MIAHISVPARQPRNTALFFAAVIDGEAFEFPVVPGAWIAVARDRSGLAVEVYPNAMAHHPGVGAVDPALITSEPRTMPWEDQIFPEEPQTRPTGFHAAITTTLTQAQVLELARAAGWKGIACERAGVFGVVEVWVDNLVLVEVLIPREVERYKAFMNLEGCASMFGKGTAPGVPSPR